MAKEQQSQALATIPADKVEKLDKIAEQHDQALAKSERRFERAMVTAQAMQELRSALTDDVMQPIMGLMNSRLGFRTDHDPNIKDKQGQPMKPYPEAVVKDCLIEATLRGLYPVGNEFNIIAGGCYVTKEGFTRLLKQIPGFADFKPNLGVPKQKEGGAIVPAKATWKLNGVADGIECEIPVKVNNYMGADAILGKAQRKLLARVYAQITGSELSEGDVEDTDAGMNRQPGEPAKSGQRLRDRVNGGPKEAEAQPEANEEGQSQRMKEIRSKAEVDGVTEAELVAWAQQVAGVDEKHQSLAAIEENGPDALNTMANAWAKAVKQIKEQRGGEG